MHAFHVASQAQVHRPDGGIEIAWRVRRVIRSQGTPLTTDVFGKSDEEALVQQSLERPAASDEREKQQKRRSEKGMHMSAHSVPRHQSPGHGGVSRIP